ncbi:MAG: mycocerosate synthase, partial [Blastocatellia bacterium]|nr:mycocerosate synthase [Blastocatellia bacterium]
MSLQNVEKIEQTKVSDNKREIAVIGISCRFPGAENYIQYWEILKQGSVTVTEVPRDRWDWREYWGDPTSNGNKTNSRWGGFLSNIDTFDTQFFSMSNREVEVVDPQQRIMLEVAWSCLEDAYIIPSSLSGKKVGVFIGTFNYDYKEIYEKNPDIIEAYQATGMSPAVIANRISHFFGFTGPSIALDTACSSSLNAIHLAAQSLRTGECSIAMAGGVNLLLTPTRHISFSKAGLMSPTGSCKSFDHRADGYVRSEGAAIILLKPLADALRDGDRIFGLIKGTAVNHCGKTHTLTYPSSASQADVIREAIERSGIATETISYVEAHGTGTPKGDPIEMAGLIEAFGKTDNEPFCAVGSVKGNIGHLEASAGIAGTIKVLLAMQHKQLPPLPHFEKLNPKISLENTPFFMVDHLQEWNAPRHGEQLLARRAGVSSFGFGGTNAHIVLEESPNIELVRSKPQPYYLIAVSGKSLPALQRNCEALADWLQERADQIELSDLSGCLLAGRTHFKHRAAFIAKSVEDVISNLRKETISTQEANSNTADRTRKLMEGLAKQLLA